MKRRFLQILLLCPVFLFSCLTNPAIKDNVYYNSGKKEKGIFYNITLQELVIQSPGDITPIDENTKFILSLLINKYTQEVKPKAVTNKDIYASIKIKEAVFNKDFENFNTISLEIELYNSTDTASRILEITAFYTEETKNTITSNTYLYSILETVFRKIFY